MLDENFQTKTSKADLYSYVRVDEIKELSEEADLKRIKMVGVDGPTDYIRPILNKLDDEDFEIYKKYTLSIAERLELIGASSHILDILKK